MYPTKTFLKSASVFKTVNRANFFGITTENITFDWTKIVDRKDKVVKQLTSGVSFLLKKNKVDVINGFGEILSSSQVKVDTKIYDTKNVIIATGSSAIMPPIDGVKRSL